MKIKEFEVVDLLKNAFSFSSILIYGPDQGLVKERAKTAIESISNKFENSVNISNLSIDDIKDSNNLLIDSVLQANLLAKKNIVRIKMANDSLTNILKSFLESTKPNQGGFVLLESQNLNPNSSLRKLFENDKSSPIISCYQDTKDTIINTINSTTKELSINMDKQSMDYLSTRLGNDREITKQEINKLALYTNFSKEPITFDKVLECIGDHSINNINKLCDQIGNLDILNAISTLETLLSEGGREITIIRSMLLHFQKLLYIKLSDNQAKEIQNLKPPIHFLRLNNFKKQLEHWNVENIISALNLINNLEIKSKDQKYKSKILIRQVLLKMKTFQ